MKFHATVGGFKDLDKMLDGFSSRMTSGVLNRALAKAAAPIAERAQQLVPVKTGRLKRAIKVSKKSEVEASGKIANGEAKVFVGVTGWPARYAEEIEFGTIEHAAQPFMRPAVAEKKEAAVQILKTELAAEIGKTRQRAEKRAAKEAAARDAATDE